MYKEDQPHIGNCPHCTKVIFKEATFNSEASFSMRCPHCNKTVRVLIKHKIEITIIAVDVESKQKKMGPGHGLVAFFFVLYLPPLIHHLAENMDNIIDIVT